jgi:hypothetical protein
MESKEHIQTNKQRQIKAAWTIIDIHSVQERQPFWGEERNVCVHIHIAYCVLIF